MTLKPLTNLIIALIAVTSAGLSAHSEPPEFIWAQPELLYSDALEQYGIVERGIDVASDVSGNLVSVWLRPAGGSENPAIQIMKSTSSNFGANWSDSAAISSVQTDGILADADVVYAGNNRWVVLWAVEHEGTDDVDFYKSISTNTGSTWSAAEFVSTQPVKKFANFFNTPERAPLDIASDGISTVLATFRSTVLRSADNGSNWTFFTPPDTMNQTLHERNRWSSLARTENQQWLHAYSRNSQGIGATPSDSVYISRSTDDGLTWSDAIRFPGDSLQLSDLTADGENAIISMNGYTLSPLTEGTFTSVSSDAGATWSPVVPVGRQAESKLALQGSNAAMLVSDSQLQSHTSSNAGATWSPESVALTKQVDLGDVVAGNSGTFIAVFDEQQDGTFNRNLATIRSLDYGATWNLSGIIDSEIAPNVGYTDLKPSIAADPYGTVIATWLSVNSVDERVMYAVSNDGGQSWSNARILGGTLVDDNDYPIGPPKIMYAHNQTWIAGWEWIAGFLYVQSRSTDNGQTWSKPTVIQSDVSSYEIWAGNEAGILLGKAASTTNAWYIRSDDRGANWRWAEGENYGVAVTNLNGNNWIKIENEKAYISSDNAETWSEQGSLSGFGNPSIVKMTSNPDGILIAAAIYAGDCVSCPGVFKSYTSLDQGANWIVRTVPLTSTVTNSFEIALEWLEDDTWLLATGQNDNYDLWTITTDNGSYWAPFSDDGSVATATTSGRAIALTADQGPSGIDMYSQLGQAVKPSAAIDWQLFD